MNYGMYLSAASCRIGQVRMDVLANNLANVNTASFKRDMTVVRSRQGAAEFNNVPHLATPVLDELVGGLLPGGVYTDFTQGKLIKTDGELDVALQGDGFFSVMADGELRYSRDGRFARSSDGYLVTAANGYPVLDDSGSPIALPAGPVDISAEGVLSAGGGQVQLAITDFAGPTDLRKAGGNTYTAIAAAQQRPSAATVRQYYVEGSGVEPARSLVDMITAQRHFEASGKMIEYANSMLDKAVNQIAGLA